jgi:hypothetical protein
MKRLTKLKTGITLVLIFLASAVYAAAVSEIAKVSTDLSLPLIFNGIVPSGLILFVGKKVIEKLENHGDRITKVETHIDDCPNCPGGKK